MSKLLDLLYKYRWFVAIFFLALIGVTAFFSISVKRQTDRLIAEKKEAERPAEIDVVTIITPDCSQCLQIIQNLRGNLPRQLNIAFSNQKELVFSTPQAQELIAKLQITQVPALILSGEIGKDQQIKQALLSLGEEKQGSIVVAGQPPYQVIDDPDIVGEFTVTYVTDESCLECYDVKINKNILASFGMLPFKETIVDKNSLEGRGFINRYGITKVPTILLRGDLSEYTRFQQVWPDVGRVADDGTHVFEAVDQMGVYRDLSQDKIIEGP